MLLSWKIYANNRNIYKENILYNNMEFDKKDKPHSIEVNRTSTGKYSYSVKMYFEDVSEAESVSNQVIEMEAKLKERYIVE